jgi:hypothetical protein
MYFVQPEDSTKAKVVYIIRNKKPNSYYKIFIFYKVTSPEITVVTIKGKSKIVYTI